MVVQDGTYFTGLEHLSCEQTLYRVWFHCHIFQELFARSALNEVTASQSVVREWPSTNTQPPQTHIEVALF